MIPDRHKIDTIFILCISVIVICAEDQNPVEGQNEGNPEARALFSPRVDYNEWLPVGRGDPLKNDPTYDYSPPVLDRVHYWGASNKSKEKKEILLLGVTSKRSHKKEPKYNSVMRRNFYSHLPTRLMPPPMQTMPPSMKHPSTETYHGMYYHNNYNTPSQGWSHNSINYGDSNVEESINYVSISRPNKNSMRNDYSPQYVTSSSSRKPWLHALLEKEVTKPTTSYVMQPSRSVFESHPPPSTLPSTTLPTTTIAPLTTTTPTATEETPYFQPTIAPVSLTTDSLFSHYNQPPQLIPGPMYLIIEGHSKVKTYGLKDNATGNDHIAKIVPIETTDNAVIKHVVSKDENGDAMEVKHLHRIPTVSPAAPVSTPLPSGMGNLLSLLDTSLGSFFLSAADQPAATKTKSKVKSGKSDKIIPDRESRQIFDYDDLPESSIRDQDEVSEGDFRITLEPKSFVESEYSSTEFL